MGVGHKGTRGGTKGHGGGHKGTVVLLYEEMGRWWHVGICSTKGCGASRRDLRRHKGTEGGTEGVGRDRKGTFGWPKGIWGGHKGIFGDMGEGEVRRSNGI